MVLTFSAVLLDVDGTLVNTIDLSVVTLGEAILDVGGSAPPSVELRRAMHLTSLEVAERFAPKDPERLLDAWRERFYARYGENRLYPGIGEGLVHLRAGGYRLAAVTAETRQELDHTLEFFGLARFFAATVPVDEVARPKPAPDSLLLALERLGARAEEAVCLGDSPTDREAARAAGIASAAALWGAHPASSLLAAAPDFVFTDFPTFVSWLCPCPWA